MLRSVNNNMEENQGLNKLVIVGNGFDLAHGLETSYKHFMGWYKCKAFNKFCNEQYYADTLTPLQVF